MKYNNILRQRLQEEGLDHTYITSDPGNLGPVVAHYITATTHRWVENGRDHSRTVRVAQVISEPWAAKARDLGSSMLSYSGLAIKVFEPQHRNALERIADKLRDDLSDSVELQ